MTSSTRSSPKLLAICLLATIAPFAVLWYRNQPLRATDVGHLSFTIMKRERNRIVGELSRRSSDSIAPSEAAPRWRSIKQMLLDAGESPTQAAQIIDDATKAAKSYDARGYEKPHLPLVAAPRIVKGNSVWFFLTVAQSDDPPSPSNRDWECREIVVGAPPPGYPVDVSSLPHCYGPQTPFVLDEF